MRKNNLTWIRTSNKSMFLTMAAKVNSKNPVETETDFDWVQLRKDIGPIQVQETGLEKFKRKINENPLVPIGCLATFCALSYGLWSFKNGDRKMSQFMMRCRIAAQGFTIVALVVGIGLTTSKQVMGRDPKR